MLQAFLFLLFRFSLVAGGVLRRPGESARVGATQSSGHALVWTRNMHSAAVELLSFCAASLASRHSATLLPIGL